MVDPKDYPNKIFSFYYVIVLHIIAWVYGWVVQEEYTSNPPSLDWADKGFAKGMFVIILWRKSLNLGF